MKNTFQMGQNLFLQTQLDVSTPLPFFGRGARFHSVFTIVCRFEPNDSEPRLLLGSAWIHRVLVSICLGRGNLFCSSSLPQVKGSELGIQCKLHETGSGSDRDFDRLGRGIGPQVLILGEKMLYLLRGAADKGGRIQERIELMLGETEFRLPGQTGEKVTGEPFPHERDRLHGAAPDQLMQLLAVAAALDALHQEVFGGDEGEILPDAALDDLLIHAEP